MWTRAVLLITRLHRSLMPSQPPEEHELHAARVGFAAHNAAQRTNLTWDDLGPERQATLLRAVRRIRQFRELSLVRLCLVVDNGLVLVSKTFVGAVAGYYLDHP
jgi:hypothetical protein